MCNKLFSARRNLNGLGFTLLELLVALFIFTLISVMVLTTLHTLLNIKARTQQHSDRLVELQIALLLVSRDIEQAINRPVVIENGEQAAAFIGKNTSITFTHGGTTNPLGQLTQSTLQRTQYSLVKNNLIRTTWPVLDPAPGATPNQRIILKNITALHFTYLNNKGNFENTWPPPTGPQQSLPKAVRVAISIKNWGQIKQLYLIPAGDP